jgi:hypothetical protein
MDKEESNPVVCRNRDNFQENMPTQKAKYHVFTHMLTLGLKYK